MKGPQNKPSREGSVPAVSPTDGTRPPERRVPPLGTSSSPDLKKKNARARAALAGIRASLPAPPHGGLFHQAAAHGVTDPSRQRSAARRANVCVHTGSSRGAGLLPEPRCGAAWKRRRNATRDFFLIFFFSFARKPLLGPPAAFGSRRLFVRGRQHSRLFVSRLSLCAYQSTKRLLLPPSTTRGRSRRGAREARALAGV